MGALDVAAAFRLGAIRVVRIVLKDYLKMRGSYH